ncbi:hypothetical protein [Aureliella helgolandensis]|uniref:Uncharacterized protein n=1 Tax=Aureliella helgolandensis TaxID=2527968 RepID=A0A518G966_9BACT|nr:hypothetical protein [Aureliella helgolandensis]QDV25113.1 hypothetical protein Q31a_34360 [Aureliella helgolandensis]
MPLPSWIVKLKTSGIGQLGLAIVALGIVWLGILPWVAQQPRVKARLEWLDEKRIDPSAMYYTELEIMESIIKRLEKR